MTPAGAGLRALADRAGILDCHNRYAQGIDQRHWPLYLSAFAPGAVIAVPGWAEGPLGAERFRDMLCEAFDHNRLSGQHILGNSAITIAGDTAHSVIEYLAVTLEEAATPGHAARQVTAGLYVDDLARGADGIWRITQRTLSRKTSDEATIAFVPPVADAVRRTLATGWPFPILAPQDRS